MAAGRASGGIDKSDSVGYQLVVMLGANRIVGVGAMRLTCVLLLVTFFLIPLHSHAQTDAPRISKDCSCLHASRQDLVVVQVVDGSLPQVYADFTPLVPQVVCSGLDGFTFSIRAPPLF